MLGDISWLSCGYHGMIPLRSLESTGIKVGFHDQLAISYTSSIIFLLLFSEKRSFDTDDVDNKDGKNKLLPVFLLYTFFSFSYYGMKL